ncbi:hypothetical protein F5Y10DRAFT_270586 [Nemania abortiva]|nr:hypothetical protein F5Y10DRAFT_270586 [Nemania abortiva]
MVDVSKELLRELRKQRTFTESEDVSPTCSSETKTAGHGERNDSFTTVSTVRKRPRRERPALIFITYSLSSWVVRHMLTHYNEPAVSVFDTLGMILLDDLDGDLDDVNILKYLNELWPMLSSRKQRPPIDLSFLKNLIYTDSFPFKSDRAHKEQPKQNQPKALIQSKFDVWITRPQSEKDEKIATWRTIIPSLGETNQRIPKGRMATEATCSESSPNLLRHNIDIVINDLLVRQQSMLKRHLLHDLRDPKHQNDSACKSLSKTNPTSPNLIHNIIPTGTRPSLFKISHKQENGSTCPPVAQPITSSDKRTSVDSYPTVNPNTTSDPELGILIKSVYRDLKQSEIKLAEGKLRRYQKRLENLDDHQKIRYGIQIRAQLAIIELKRGNYEKAQKDFNDISGDMDKGLGIHEQYVVKRWIAVSLLSQGYHTEATIRLESLLETIPNEDSYDLVIKIPIRRDLALASAYQGDYQEALGHIREAWNCLEQILKDPKAVGTDESLYTEISEASAPLISIGCDEIQESAFLKVRDNHLRRMLRAKRDRLYLTESQIYYMLGDFKTAFEKSKKAFNGVAINGVKTERGIIDQRALEWAGYRSMLLALNSHISKSDTLSSLALGMEYRKLVSQVQLVKTIGHIVNTDSFLWRLDSAGDTIKSTIEESESLLPTSHPQTHHFRYLAAQNFLARGAYASAEVEIEKIIKRSSPVYQKCHSYVLQYRSLLALAKYHLGKLREAEELVIAVLQDQLRIHTKCDKQTPENTYDRQGFHETAKTLLNYKGMIEDLLAAINKSPGDPKFPSCILQTLRTVALIAEHYDHTDFAVQILEAIWKRNEYLLDYSSMLTLDSEYDLARTYCHDIHEDPDHDTLLEAVRHQRLVYQGRHSVLGPAHPKTCSARRELITLNTVLERWEPPLIKGKKEAAKRVTEEVVGCEQRLSMTEWVLIVEESDNIVLRHEALGEDHPETLISLLWLLTIQVHLQATSAVDETVCKWLRRIRRTSVRRERFFESLDLELRFAWTLRRLGGKYEFKALQIVREISYAIEESPAARCSALRESIEHLREEIDEQIDTLFPKVNSRREEWKAKLQAEFEDAVEESLYAKAATHQAELWSLLVSLDRPDNARAIDARIKSAKFLVRAPKFGDKRNGLQILKDLETEYSKALTHDQRQRIQQIKWIVEFDKPVCGSIWGAPDEAEMPSSYNSSTGRRQILELIYRQSA